MSDEESLPRSQNYRFCIRVYVFLGRVTHPAYDIEHFSKVAL